MRRVCVLAALCLSLAAPPAMAGERVTAQELARMCNSASDVDYGYCGGYVTAVADAMLAKGAACNHAHVKSQQYIDVFRAYAELFPDRLSGDAAAAVEAAVTRAFPCR